VPAKVPRLVTVMVEVAELSNWIKIELGLALTVKSCVTVNIAVKPVLADPARPAEVPTTRMV
jgi:hypothetical protein